MSRLSLSCVVCLLLLPAQPASSQEPTRLAFSGKWVDTGLPTTGPMAAGVTSLGSDRWNARFTGVFEGREFDYTVEFSGPRDSLSGEARINGAKYVWRGRMTEDGFFGSYRSNRSRWHVDDASY